MKLSRGASAKIGFLDTGQRQTRSLPLPSSTAHRQSAMRVSDATRLCPLASGRNCKGQTTAARGVKRRATYVGAGARGCNFKRKTSSNCRSACRGARRSVPKVRPRRKYNGHHDGGDTGLRNGEPPVSLAAHGLKIAGT